MPTASTIVQSQVNAADSTASTVSDKVKGDGYFGNSDGLHTVAYVTSSDWLRSVTTVETGSVTKILLNF